MTSRIGVVLSLLGICSAAHAERIEGNGVEIKKYSARLDGFGTVMVATFTLKNLSSYVVKDIEVQCDHYGASGTKLGTSRKIIYQSLKSQQTLTFPEVNMGFVPDQADSFNCRTVSFVR